MEKAIFRTICLGLLLTSKLVFSQGGSDFLGEVRYQNDMPMSNVNAYLHDSTGNIIGTAVTDDYGVYTFPNLMPGEYTLTFDTYKEAGGIELNDAYLVEQYLLGQYDLSPIQVLAADVDGDGFVTIEDYNLIWLGYLNQCNPFPVGPWVFEPASFTWPMESRDGLTTKAGSSSGDVNGSLVPDPKISPIFLNSPVMDITTDSSDPIEFKLSGGENLKITGMHLVIKVPDDLELISVGSSIAQASIFISGNQIRVTWMDESHQGFELAEGSPLLVIRTNAKGSCDGKSYRLKLSDESHFLNIDGKMLTGVQLIMPTINVIILDEFSHIAYPNPFSSYSNIDYMLPQDGQVTINLYDQSGRQVSELENGVRLSGSHQVRIDGTSLSPGIYYYNIRYSGSDQITNTGTIIKSK
jgi:hypothetical protein